VLDRSFVQEELAIEVLSDDITGLMVTVSDQQQAPTDSAESTSAYELSSMQKIAIENEDQLYHRVQASSIFAGKLQKKRGKESWSGELWFMLTPDKLWYCRLKVKERMMASITLSEDAKCRCTTKKEAYLMVAGEGGSVDTYKFKASKSEDMRSWVEAITFRQRQNNQGGAFDNDPIAEAERELVGMEMASSQRDQQLLQQLDSMDYVLRDNFLCSHFERYLESIYWCVLHPRPPQFYPLRPSTHTERSPCFYHTHCTCPAPVPHQYRPISYPFSRSCTIRTCTIPAVRRICSSGKRQKHIGSTILC
jgi:hypothetical protein